MIDFDEIDIWAPAMGAVLSGCVPDEVEDRLRAQRPRYIEDALELLFALTDHRSVVEATLDWVRSERIKAYHGTRLTEKEIHAVRTQGLVPLAAEARRERLIRALSSHPDWSAAASGLDEELIRHGQGERAGRRERQVHLTLSRAGLTDGFNHYLKYGSEFDQHVAYALLGTEGQKLLHGDGIALVVEAVVPGEDALRATHPYFDMEYVWGIEGAPNLIRELLTAWSYRLAHPGYQSRTLRLDCGMIFRSTVPASWILGIHPQPLM